MSDYDEAYDLHRHDQDVYNEELDAHVEQFPKEKSRQLDEALYVFDQRGFFEGLAIQPELALRVWALVERVRVEGFPDSLGM